MTAVLTDPRQQYIVLFVIALAAFFCITGFYSGNWFIAGDTGIMVRPGPFHGAGFIRGI